MPLSLVKVNKRSSLLFDLECYQQFLFRTQQQQIAIIIVKQFKIPSKMTKIEEFASVPTILIRLLWHFCSPTKILSNVPLTFGELLPSHFTILPPPPRG